MRYKSYLLNVLLFVLAFNCVDRQALGLALQDIKLDLQLSDTQLGLLTGIAFALFYSLMGIPLARWADRGNRVTIISITTALWSAAVALSALAGNFLQLMVIRIGAAVGEAGCVPPAHSLIADHFSREERPRAVARYMMGAPLSVIIGYFLAGWLNELYGWRVMFMALGLPGIALALLAGLTLKEPRLGKAPVAAPAQPSLTEVYTTLSASATFRHLLFCFSLMSFFSLGIAQWQPTFFIRSYGLSTGELGIWLTVVFGLSGFAGTYLGGELASRYAAANERLQLKAAAVMYSVLAIVMASIFVAPNHYIAFAALALSAAGGAMASGPLFATIQTLVPQRMRAMSIAMTYLFANLIGMGLGPLAAGMLSDAFRPWAGEESLRYALLALCPGYLWGAWHMWRASRNVTRDVEALNAAS